MSSRLNLISLVAAIGAIAVLAGACTATETVTISPAAIAAATSTAEVAAPPEPTPAAPDTTEPNANPVSPASAAGEGCTYLGVDDFGDMQIELNFSSSLERQGDATGIYRVIDPAGNDLVNSSTFFEDLLPGEQVRMHVDTFEDGPLDADVNSGITCAFEGLEAFDFGPDPFRPEVGDTCRFVELDSFDDIQIELEFTYPLSEPGEVAVDFVLRGPGDVRFEDGVAFAQGQPGARIVEPVDTFTEFPNWASESNFSCHIVAIEGF